MLPFIQLETDFLTTGAPMAAAILKAPRQLVVGMAVDAIAFGVTATSTPEKAPDGILLDPDAEAILEAVMGWQGPKGAAVDAFVRVGLLQRLDVGMRIRGMDRYAAAWAVAASRTAKAKAAAKRRWGNAPAMLGACSEHARPMLKSCSADAQPMLGDAKTETETETETEKEETHTSPEAPVGVLQQLWNEGRPNCLPAWEAMTAKRKKKAAARLKERPPEEWRQVIARIRASSFCLGGGPQGWRANPDWLLQPDTAAKVLEGQYDNRGPSPPRQETFHKLQPGEDLYE